MQIRFRKISYLWIGLTLCLAVQTPLAASLTEVDVGDNSCLTVIADEIKDLKFLLKKEFASQVIIRSELKADINELKNKDDILMGTLMQNALTQDDHINQLHKTLQANNLIFGLFAFLLVLIFWLLRAVNLKLKKGIEIKSADFESHINPGKGQSDPLGLEDLEGDPQEPKEGPAIINRGIIDEDLHKILDRQLGLYGVENVKLPPVKQDELWSEKINSLIKRRMAGFMRPTSTPKL